MDCLEKHIADFINHELDLRKTEIKDNMDHQESLGNLTPEFKELMSVEVRQIKKAMGDVMEVTCK